jgi:hypothetical protein
MKVFALYEAVPGVDVTGMQFSMSNMTDDQLATYLASKPVWIQWLAVLTGLSPIIMVIVFTVLGCTVWSH